MKALIFLAFLSGCAESTNPVLESNLKRYRAENARIDWKYSHPQSRQEQINDLILESQRNEMDARMDQIEEANFRANHSWYYP